MILTPMHDPLSGAYWCALACPLPYRTEEAASACRHELPPVPYCPGEPVRRPAYVPATARRANLPTTYRPRRWWPVLLFIVLAGVLALSAVVVVLGAYADTHPRPAPASTPTTYGVPLPRGGCCVAA